VLERDVDIVLELDVVLERDVVLVFRLMNFLTF